MTKHVIPNEIPVELWKAHAEFTGRDKWRTVYNSTLSQYFKHPLKDVEHHWLISSDGYILLATPLPTHLFGVVGDRNVIARKDLVRLGKSRKPEDEFDVMVETHVAAPLPDIGKLFNDVHWTGANAQIVPSQQSDWPEALIVDPDDDGYCLIKTAHWKISTSREPEWRPQFVSPNHLERVTDHLGPLIVHQGPKELSPLLAIPDSAYRSSPTWIPDDTIALIMVTRPF